jgi:uncharacterized protein with HEPN domain
MDRRDRQALIDIRDVLDRALGYPIEGVEAFYEKDYLQDAVIRCLEILGEASKSLRPELRRLQPQVPWRAMAGMRDILIHAYDPVDLEEVWMAYQRYRLAAAVAEKLGAHGSLPAAVDTETRPNPKPHAAHTSPSTEATETHSSEAWAAALLPGTQAGCGEP